MKERYCFSSSIESSERETLCYYAGQLKHNWIKGCVVYVCLILSVQKYMTKSLKMNVWIECERANILMSFIVIIVCRYFGLAISSSKISILRHFPPFCFIIFIILVINGTNKLLINVWHAERANLMSDCLKWKCFGLYAHVSKPLNMFKQIATILSQQSVFNASWNLMLNSICVCYEIHSVFKMH